MQHGSCSKFKEEKIMAMIVQHNMSAANANRMLGITTGQQSKSTEKLASGYKINRAADDAAGLAISEKMRYAVRGLNRASLKHPLRSVLQKYHPVHFEKPGSNRESAHASFPK